EVEISREQRLQAPPIEMSWPRFLRVIPADFDAGVFDRQSSNAVDFSRNYFDQVEMKKRFLGGEVDSSRRARVGCDMDSFDRDGPEQWRSDFAKVDFQLLSTCLPAQPDANAA